MKNKILINNFFILIICSLPFIEYSISNIHELSYYLYIDLSIILFLVIFFIILFSFITNYFLNLFLKNKFIDTIDISIIFSLFFYSLFKYKDLFDITLPLSLFQKFQSIHSESILLFCLIIFIIFAYFYLSKILILKRFIYIFFISFFFISIFNLFFKYYENVLREQDLKLASEKNIKKYLSKKSQKRNIYYVILDQAADPVLFNKIHFKSSLQKYFDQFDDNFTYIPNSFSSYNATYLAVSSAFQLDYPVDENSPKYSSLMNFFPNNLKKNDPLLIKILHKNNYKFFWTGNTWAPCINFRKQDCFLKNKDKITAINTHVLSSFLNKSPFLIIYNLIFNPQVDLQRDNINTFIKKYKKFKFKKNKNYFFFIHHMMPHGPHIHDSACNIKFTVAEWKDYYKKNGTRTILEGYKDDYICALQRAKELIEIVNIKDPNAIILFQGDTGQDFRQINTYTEYKKKLDKKDLSNMDQFITMNLNAIYEKQNECNKKSLKENKFSQYDNVNTMIFVVNCAMDLNIKLKKKKTLYGTYPKDGVKTFGKVFNIDQIRKNKLTDFYTYDK